MRTLLLATMLLAASSSLNSSFAQDQGEPKPPRAPQSSPAQTDQNSPQQRDQQTDRDRSKDDDRAVYHERMMRRGDNDRMGRDRDIDRGRYSDRGNRDDDYAGRDRSDRGYRDEAPPRHRVKICVEYDNGEEFCRYKQ